VSATVTHPAADNPFSRLAALRARTDEDATRELVAALVSGPPDTRLEAARAVHGRTLPEDVRADVAALLGNAVEAMPDGGLSDPLRRWMYACAARAVFESSHSPADAWAQLAPFLEPATTGTAPGRVRAVKILEEVEEQLASHWRSRGRQPHVAPPDERFVTACEQLLAGGGDVQVRIAAGLAREAFQFLVGASRAPAFQHVELGEQGDAPFPFLVAGFPVSRPDNLDLLESLHRVSALPPGLCAFHHQYGGRACHHAVLLGYAVTVPARLETSSLRLLREACIETTGEPFARGVLGEWHRALCGTGAFPPLELGTEALLVSHPCEPGLFLEGGPVLTFGTSGPPWRRMVDLLSEDPDITPGPPYGPLHDLALQRVGQALGLGSPRLAYTWGNSD